MSENGQVAIHPAQFEEIPEEGAASSSSTRIDSLMSVGVNVAVELGRGKLTVRDVLALRPGAIIELDHDAGAQVDLMVNKRLIAKAEVVVTADDHMGVRLTEIVSPEKRLHA